ncbi:hypothetical protein ZIOFF_054688 [Zingiber officinale]|uniref:Uncharacterized protein n=1 Tax=Zingiber officinale TaxID=94328 RepID=A0A8J5FKF8_ZINOF|nr:hypothetical protein ZIOFF_054688 [Zingiber officinale]
MVVPSPGVQPEIELASWSHVGLDVEFAGEEEIEEPSKAGRIAINKVLSLLRLLDIPRIIEGSESEFPDIPFDIHGAINLDVVEVISSSLVIPKSNGRDDYIDGSELQANMKRMDTSYALE